MVRNLHVLTSIDYESCRNECSRLVVDARNRRATSLAETHLPLRIRFRPGRDELLTACPLESLIVDDEDRNSIASRRSPTNRAVTDYDVRKIGIDLEADRSAIAFAACHKNLTPRDIRVLELNGGKCSPIRLGRRTRPASLVASACMESRGLGCCPADLR